MMKKPSNVLLIPADRRYEPGVSVTVARSFPFLGHAVVTLLLLVSSHLWAKPGEDSPLSADTKVPDAPERRLNDWAAKHRVALSVSVSTIPEGRLVFTLDGGTARNPASVSKLATAFVALRTLGPSHEFRTGLYGRIRGGHIERLVIRGEGDPSFSSEHLLGMAARLAALGVTHVDSAIAVDQTYFDGPYVPPAFEQQPNEWAAFRAPVCATALDGNRLVLRVVPTSVGSDARAVVQPIGGVRLSGRVRTVERDTKGSRVQLGVVPGSEQPTIRIGGEIGITESAIEFERRLDDPRLVAGYALRDALTARGIRVAEGVTLGAVDELPLLEVHRSEALGILVHRMGKESDNFVAEMLLKAIGKRAGEGTSAAGAAVIMGQLGGLGAAPEQARWMNGSGLFDANRMSTDLVTRLLTAAAMDPLLAPEFTAQLSIGGIDGTLTKRLRGLPKGCVVRAKTGTLRQVISMAGYLTRPDRRVWTFAVIAEQVSDQAATKAEIDRFVETLCSVQPAR